MRRVKKRKTHNRNKVKELWSFCKHCYWCGKETVMQKSGATDTEHNTATFDHLYHRTEPERKKYPNKGVLACYDCNQKRGREAYIKTLPLWNQWLIASSLHKPLYHVKKTLFILARRSGLID